MKQLKYDCFAYTESVGVTRRGRWENTGFKMPLYNINNADASASKSLPHSKYFEAKCEWAAISLNIIKKDYQAAINCWRAAFDSIMTLALANKVSMLLSEWIIKMLPPSVIINIFLGNGERQRQRLMRRLSMIKTIHHDMYDDWHRHGWR